MTLRRFRSAWFASFEPWYAILALSLIAGAALHLVNNRWIGDFWEHAAVVRELATHPITPRHPELLLDAPHAFFSPYAVLLGWLSRLTGIDAVSTLSIAAIANLLLLLAVLPRAIHSLLNVELQSRTAFYALLFMLALWTAKPWAYSGFFHLGVIFYVLPYPSTIAFVVALGIWIFSSHYAKTGSRRDWATLVVLIGFNLLTHLPTAAITIAGMVALIIAQRTPVRRAACIGATLPVAFAVAAAWPFYPFVALLLQGGVYDASNIAMYQDVAGQVGLFIAGAAALLWRARRDRRDWLVWTATALAGIYAVGFVRESWSLGRVLGPLSALLQWACASWVAQCGEGLLGRAWPRRGVVFAAAVLLIANGLLAWGGGKSLAPVQRESYAFQHMLAERIGQYDVVLTDVSTGVQIPAFSGKVIVTDQPLAFVPDLDERDADVARFFDMPLTATDRRVLLAKYTVRWVLVNRGQVANPAAHLQSLAALADVVYDDGRMTLLQVRDDLTR
ncbi:MAG: hypothetical protein HZB53_09225 [Chloroflexi bacterium]|nr:hypothetical protein [Chloroflexota bacterium]